MLEVKFDVLSTYKAWRMIDKEAVRIDTNVSTPATYSIYYFRKGMEGFSIRLQAAANHYNELHMWLPQRFIRRELHVPNLLFNLTSAIQCFQFAVNALGNAKDAKQFRDVTDSSAVYAANPDDVIGNQPLAGFNRYFPLLQSHWIANSLLVRTIFEYHDVSKYRAVQDNGDAIHRTDPPVGFFDGVRDDARLRSSYTPYETIILGPQIKTLRGIRNKSWLAEPYSTLEQVMTDFKPFTDASLVLTLADAKAL